MSVLSLRRHSRGLGLSPRRRAAKGGAQVPMVIQEGLVAEWRFNEGAGQVLTDFTGNGHHGQLGTTAGADAADPIWTAQGLSFDGGDFVDCGNVGISGAAARTLCAVMRPAAGTPTIGVEWKDPATNVAGQRWTFRKNQTSDNFRLECFGSGTNHTSDLVPNTWVFLAATHDGSATFAGATLYYNDIAVPASGSQVLNTVGPLRWGIANGATVAMEAAYGLVYNRALSAGEIEQNRQALASILA